MNAFLLEKLNLKQSAPVDLNVAAVTGPRIKMDNSYRLAIAVLMGTSTAATVQFSLKQHTAATGGTSKDLSVANAYFHKAGAATVFTKVEPSVAAASYDVSSVFAADAGIIVFEVLADDLDVDAGFAWVSLDIADSGAAKLASVLHVAHEVKDAPAYAIAL